MENETNEAIRLELIRLLQPPLTVASLSALMRMAEAAREMIRAGTVRPEDLTSKGTSGANIIGLGGTVEETLPPDGQNIGYDALPVPAAPQETFGARMIRELLAAIPAMMQRQHETPENLVAAIAQARSSGMHDVATQLAAKLGIEIGPGAASMVSPDAVTIATKPVTSPEDLP